MNNTLNLTNSGTLNIMDTDYDGIRVRSDAVLTLINNGNMTIGNNIERDGIGIVGTMNFTNSNNFTVGPDILGDGIFVLNGGNINLTNQITGTITTSPNANIDLNFFSVEDNPGMPSAISNFGNMTIDMDNNGDDFMDLSGSNISFVNQSTGTITVSNVVDDAFDFSFDASFSNSQTINITNIEEDAFVFYNGATLNNSGTINTTNVMDDAFNFDQGATLDNFGTINAINTMDEAFDISRPGGANNHASGIIVINGVMDEDAINLSCNFVNDGMIMISNVQTGSAIGIEQTGLVPGMFINNNLIEIGLSVTSNIAIELDAGTSLTNNSCGIINISTAHPIVNNGTITNTGTITTVFTGLNTNNNVFENNGIISSSNNTFVSPNPLTGTNTTAVPSPIPAQKIAISGRDLAICAGQSVDLSSLINGTPQNTLQYGLSFGNYNLGATGTQSPTTNTTYFVRDSNMTTMCADTAMITVTVSPVPMITGRDTTVMLGQSIDLSNLLNEPVTGNLDFGTTLGQYGITNPVTPTGSMPFFIRDSIYNPAGCSDTARVFVNIPGVLIPHITDPCNCYDPENVYIFNNGNTNLSLFHDFFTISNGGIGQTWQLSSINSGGLFQKDGTAMPLNQTMTDLGGGSYKIDFWHRPNVGFNITFQRVSDGTTVNASNSCSDANCIVIPTLSEWGLIIFGLLLLNLGIFFSRRIEYPSQMNNKKSVPPLL